MKTGRRKQKIRMEEEGREKGRERRQRRRGGRDREKRRTLFRPT